MSTPDPFGDALDARAAQANSASNDPYGDALAARAQGASVTSDDSKPLSAFDVVKGAASIGGNTLLNIPYGTVHAAGDLVRRISGNADAPETKFESALHVDPDEDATKLTSAIASNPTVQKGVQAVRSVDSAIGRMSPTAQDVLHQTIGVAGDVANLSPAVGSLVKGIGGKFASSAEAKAAAAIEEGHPLTATAKAEQAEMQANAQAAKDAGVDLPARGVTPAQQYVDDAARRDLNLPKNAPVTSGLLDQARATVATPAYQAAKAVPEFELGPKYQEAISKINLDNIDPAMRPPPGTVHDEAMGTTQPGKMTGEQAVDLSTKLRHEARTWWDYSEGAGGPPATAIARQYTAAYKAVEDGFKEAVSTADKAASVASGSPVTSNSDIATNWDKARTYVAKTYAWEDSLDGAGHAAGPKIKKLALQGEPISGPMKEAASVVAQYPELFKNTRLQTPGPGVFRKGAAAIAPMAGAGLGGALGGPGGAMVGEHVGRVLGGKIVGN